jgi:hypothetical protein
VWATRGVCPTRVNGLIEILLNHGQAQQGPHPPCLARPQWTVPSVLSPRGARRGGLRRARCGRNLRARRPRPVLPSKQNLSPLSNGHSTYS